MTPDQAAALGHAWAAYAIGQADTLADAFPGTAQEARERVVDEEDGQAPADVERLAAALLEAARERWTELVEDVRFQEAYSRDRSTHGRWAARTCSSRRGRSPTRIKRRPRDARAERRDPSRMLGRRSDPFPAREVRDLLGIVRAMWRAEKASAHPSAPRLARLKRIGESLTTALELAAASPADGVGERAAWQHAEEACAALGREETLLESVLPVVREAGRAVRTARTMRRVG